MYKVTIIYNEHVHVEGELKRAELKKTGKCATWDDVDTFIACMVEAFGSVNCEIEEVRL